MIIIFAFVLGKIFGDSVHVHHTLGLDKMRLGASRAIRIEINVKDRIRG